MSEWIGPIGPADARRAPEMDFSTSRDRSALRTTLWGLGQGLLFVATAFALAAGAILLR